MRTAPTMLAVVILSCGGPPVSPDEAALSSAATASLKVGPQAPGEATSGPPPETLLEVMEGPFGAAVGDMNDDGFADVVISNRKLHRDFPERAGTVTVYSGPDGTAILTLSGGPGFGYRVAGAGDADADGVLDVLVTTGDVSDDGPTAVAVYSGSTGRLLQEIRGANLGSSITCAGDVDGDGHDDFAFTAGFRHRVVVAAHSGRTGVQLWAAARECHGYYGSYAGLVNAGDVNSDGVQDLAFSGPAEPCNEKGWLGRLYLLSGRDGRELWAMPDESFSTCFEQESLAGVADVSGDGVRDLVVGGVAAEGRVVRLVSGADGTTMLQLKEQAAYFGWATAGLDDFDGDGVSDLAVGAPPFEADWPLGSVFVYSGATGAVLCTIQGAGDLDDEVFPGSAYSFGICLSGIGDFNGDGYSDLLIGEARGFNTASSCADRVVIVAGRPSQSAAGGDAP